MRDDIGTITQTDFGYTFQRNLPNTGLMDYRARFYSPKLLKFIQPDSIVPSPANPQSWNRYAYVGNSPINFTDPTGHRPIIDEDEYGNPIVDSDWPPRPKRNSNGDDGDEIIDDYGGGGRKNKSTLLLPLVPPEINAGTLISFVPSNSTQSATYSTPNWCEGSEFDCILSGVSLLASAFTLTGEPTIVGTAFVVDIVATGWSFLRT